jgi:translation initiation factor 5
MINIPSYIKDPSYRYQMPALKIKVEGKGNGIRTKLVNLFEVSKHLGVPPEYPLRYFGAEYGAIIEFKQNEQKAMLNGDFPRANLQKSLDHFIEKFVLCPKCKYPEICIRIKKKELFSDCKACGEVRAMDMTHKISNFILKFPPTNSKETQDNSKTGSSGKVHKKKKKDKVQDVISLKSPEVLECLERLSTEDISKAGECLSSLTVSKDFDVDLRSYLLFKGIFGDNLLSYLQIPSMVQVLKNNSIGCSEDILMALAIVYGLDESWAQKVSSIMFHLYNNDIITEETFENWSTDQLDFNESSPIYDPVALSQLKANSHQFLDWLKNAEEEQLEENNETENFEEKKTEDPDKPQDPDLAAQEKQIENNNLLETTERNATKDIMSQLKAVEDFSIDDI